MMLEPIAPTLRSIYPKRLVCKKWKEVIDGNIHLAKSINAKRLFPIPSAGTETLMAALLCAEKVNALLPGKTLTETSFPAALRDSVCLHTDLILWNGKAYFQEKEDAIAIYDLESQKRQNVSFAGRGICQLVAQSGSPVCIVKMENKIGLYDLNLQEMTHLLAAPQGVSTMRAYLVHHVLILASESTGKLYLADLMTDQEFAELPFKDQFLHDVQAVAGQKMLFVLRGSQNTTALEYDRVEKKIFCYPIPHSSTSEVFHPALNIVKILGHDLIAVYTNRRIWEFFKRGEPIRLIPQREVVSCKTQDGLLFTTDTKGYISLFDTTNLDLIHTIPTPFTDYVNIGQLCRELIFTVTSQGVISIWDLDSGKPVKQFHSPGGKRFDQTVAVHDFKLMVFTGVGVAKRKEKKVVIFDFAPLMKP